MADQRPTCRTVTVEVDGETVHARVRTTGPVTEHDLALLAAAARELRRRAEADPGLAERQAAGRARLAAARSRAGIEATDG